MFFDIVIIGAGPAGLSLAASLSNTNLKIAIIEKKQKKNFSLPKYDGREIALTHRSVEILKNIGVWNFINKKSISHVKEARIKDGSSPYSLNFSYNNTCKDFLGYIISNQSIKKAIYQKIKKTKNIKLITNTEVRSIKHYSDISRVYLSNKKNFNCHLVIAADGRLSQIREKNNISKDMTNFGTVMIVCKMLHEKSHENIALEVFNYNQTMAVLPLKGKISSIVTTVSADDYQEILDMKKINFERKITKDLNNLLGKMKLISKKYSYPMLTVHANNFFKKRIVLIGDAAVGMHPVTAHGFNLNLRGAKILSDEIRFALKHSIDIGSKKILNKYETAFKKVTLPIYLATNGIVRLYTNQTLPGKIARKAVLRLGNIAWPVKNAILDELLIKNT